jgi:uncharacterized membrane protein HdeD (DUF308 family)
MFVSPDKIPDIGRKLTREAAERLAANWWRLLLNGLLLMVAGVLIFSIGWSVRSLATFIGALFIFEGVSMALTVGIDDRVRRGNIVTGLLSIAAGVVIIVWPAPGLLVVAVFLGAWLILTGTFAIAGAFAAQSLLPDWGLLVILGILEVALGVLALADPGQTLAALITVGGIWAVTVGAMRVVLSFQLKRLPSELDQLLAEPEGAGASTSAGPEPRRLAPTGP